MADSHVVPPRDSVDNTPQASLGAVITDGVGNTFVYLKGVAGLLALDLVVYDPATYATTRSVAASKGPAAFAMGNPIATQFGWFQIGGKHAGVTATGAIVANAALGTNATTGTIGATAAGAKVENVFSTAAATAGKVAVMMTAPPFAAGLG